MLCWDMHESEILSVSVFELMSVRGYQFVPLIGSYIIV